MWNQAFFSLRSETKFSLQFQISLPKRKWGRTLPCLVHAVTLLFSTTQCLWLLCHGNLSIEVVGTVRILSLFYCLILSVINLLHTPYYKWIDLFQFVSTFSYFIGGFPQLLWCLFGRHEWILRAFFTSPPWLLETQVFVTQETFSQDDYFSWRSFCMCEWLLQSLPCCWKIKYKV